MSDSSANEQPFSRAPPRQGQLAGMQRAYGNQAVLRMLDRSRPASSAASPLAEGVAQRECASSAGYPKNSIPTIASQSLRTPTDGTRADDGLLSGAVAGAIAGFVTGGFVGGIVGGIGGAIAAVTAPKTVAIDAVKLRGATRDPSADVTFANTVFQPANIQFSLASNHTATTVDSDSWLGGDTVITYSGACGSPSMEELATWKGATTRFGLRSRLRAFYVASVSSRDRGYSYPPYCATGGAAILNGMANVSNSGASRTLAHELGHILINSGDHPPDKNNLMHPTNTATGNELTQAQRTAIYANA